MQNIRVNIINTSSNELPAYATSGSSGMDIRANLQSDVLLQPLERQLIPTGLFIELPEGYEAQMRPRSGFAIKQGITCLNSPGTIDADYRGEVGVLLINLGAADFEVKDGERVAQMVIANYVRVGFEEVPDLRASERGAGGFGHTGVR